MAARCDTSMPARNTGTVALLVNIGPPTPVGAPLGRSEAAPIPPNSENALAGPSGVVAFSISSPSICDIEPVPVTGTPPPMPLKVTPRARMKSSAGVTLHIQVWNGIAPEPVRANGMLANRPAYGPAYCWLGRDKSRWSSSTPWLPANSVPTERPRLNGSENGLNAGGGAFNTARSADHAGPDAHATPTTAATHAASDRL